jgi:hypothetical protein
MRLLKNTIAALSIAAFLVIGSVGIMAMSGHHHEPGCPFMPGEQAICQMDAFDHISAWQSTFTTILPTVVSLVLLIGVVFVFWKYYSPPDLFVRHTLKREKQNPIRVSIVQELFSSGILNPRAP